MTSSFFVGVCSPSVMPPYFSVLLFGNYNNKTLNRSNWECGGAALWHINTNHTYSIEHLRPRYTLYYLKQTGPFSYKSCIGAKRWGSQCSLCVWAVYMHGSVFPYMPWYINPSHQIRTNLVIMTCYSRILICWISSILRCDSEPPSPTHVSVAISLQQLLWVCSPH